MARSGEVIPDDGRRVASDKNGAGIPDRVKRFGPKMPIGRAGEAREVAEAIVWLLSDKASYVTGDFINVTGGAR